MGTASDFFAADILERIQISISQQFSIPLTSTDIGFTTKNFFIKSNFLKRRKRHESETGKKI